MYKASLLSGVAKEEGDQGNRCVPGIGRRQTTGVEIFWQGNISAQNSESDRSTAEKWYSQQNMLIIIDFDTIWYYTVSQKTSRKLLAVTWTNIFRFQ